VVAIERVFSQHNVRTVMGTAQASGVVALVAARAGLPVAFHTPSEVKAAVTGEGRAGKAQVTAMVTRLLQLAEAPRPADAADALALAICHCWRAPMQDRMAEARARADELAAVHRSRLADAARGAPATWAEVAAQQDRTARRGVPASWEEVAARSAAANRSRPAARVRPARVRSTEAGPVAADGGATRDGRDPGSSDPGGTVPDRTGVRAPGRQE
jgi:crossover junction endodeoxyribonuclease RuvC